jgi:hypothetical protein
VKDLLLGVAVPALVAAGGCASAWRAWRGADSRAAGQAFVPIVLALAYAVGHAGWRGWPPLPALETTQWIFWLSLLAGVVGAIESGASWGPVARWSCRGLLVAALLGLMLRPLVAHSWSTGGAAARLVLVAAAALAAWALAAALPGRTTPSAGWLVLCVTAVGAALALALSGSLALGQLAGSLAAALGAAWVVSLLPGGQAVPGAGIAVPALVLGGLVLSGRFYSELPASSALLLAAAPGAALGLPPRPAGARGGTVHALVPGLLALVPAAAAVAWAWWTSPPLEPYY